MVGEINSTFTTYAISKFSCRVERSKDGSDIDEDIKESVVKLVQSDNRITRTFLSELCKCKEHIYILTLAKILNDLPSLNQLTPITKQHACDLNYSFPLIISLYYSSATITLIASHKYLKYLNS